MTKARTRTIRVRPTSTLSLGRTRPTRNRKSSRKRPTPKKLPAKLKQIRERAGISQTEMAKHVGVKDRSSISGYERGEREPPLPTLLAYAKFARLHVEDLIDDDRDLD